MRIYRDHIVITWEFIVITSWSYVILSCSHDDQMSIIWRSDLILTIYYGTLQLLVIQIVLYSLPSDISRILMYCLVQLASKFSFCLLFSILYTCLYVIILIFLAYIMDSCFSTYLCRFLKNIFELVHERHIISITWAYFTSVIENLLICLFILLR